jgi:hypothetical protein
MSSQRNQYTNPKLFIPGQSAHVHPFGTIFSLVFSSCLNASVLQNFVKRDNKQNTKRLEGGTHTVTL